MTNTIVLPLPNYYATSIQFNQGKNIISITTTTKLITMQFSQQCNKNVKYLVPSSSIWVAKLTYSPDSPPLADPGLKFPSSIALNDEPLRRLLLLYSTHTQTICKMHCNAYPTIHSLNGMFGLSYLLKIKTVTATATKARFQIMSRTTTGFE